MDDETYVKVELQTAKDKFSVLEHSGLYFKCIPSSTFVSVNESSAPGKKGNKERVTFMPCTNADGSYKLPLMLIGKSKRPRALKNVRELPVYYASSKNAWMTRQLFKDWFFNEFVPKVTAFLEGANLQVTARLVLDNCSAHCSTDQLRTADGAFSTTFLPPNTAALLQPMDQNVIQMVKSNYKQKLMREILGRQGEFDDMVKRISIKNSMMTMTFRCRLYDNAVQEEDMEFDVLNDDDIVNVVLNPNTSFYDCNNTVSTVEGANALSVLEPHQNDMDDDAGSSVSHGTALSGIDQVIAWAEENGLPLESQFLLREI
ncbi:jerky protein homolog-like [Uranotaenia lowii]|uniref:jerky protein homolog-like n=1 Tax=Uranotaenia lowii TaxID=190385 RepID=UPI00247A57FD|nr:jerky protein homolog-like [Uranotaenia lowii]